MREIRVSMFGEFMISTEDGYISDNDNRSKKMWLLLAYLICNRGRVVKHGELIEILGSDRDRSANVSGALKTLSYRLRAELDRLWDGAGKQLIVAHNSGYTWNSDFPVTVDCETFDELCAAIDAKSEDDLEKTVELLKLYKGEFLERLSGEFWVIPKAMYYHNAYIEHLMRILPRLLDDGRYEEAVDFCHTAIAMEPFHEEVHCCLMRAYIAMGKQNRAVEIYRALSDRLLAELGVIPSEETRALYREAVKTNNEHMLTVEMLEEQLLEADSFPGALVCEFDFFRVLYYSMARSVLRSGIAVHMILFSLTDKNGDELEGSKRDKVTDILEDVIRYSLRRGDSAAKCSASQYVVMLPRANFENSCMVAERINRAYVQKTYRFDAVLRYDVFPLKPDDKENLKWIREVPEN